MTIEPDLPQPYDRPMADGPRIAIDGDMSDEKLSELLGRKAEFPQLDYKRRIDLGEKRDELELTKNVAAMQVSGGYILIGVDDDGSPVEDLDDIDTRPFDEASLRPKLLKYLPEPLGLVTRTTERDGHALVAICVMPHPDGCAYIKAHGTYTDGKGDEKPVFRAGDVFWRDGTQSVRLTQEGHREIVRRQVAEQKREWIEEQREMRREEATEHQAAAATRTLAEGELGAVSLDLSPRDLGLASLEFVRRGDRIGLRHLFNDARRRARSFIERRDKEALDALLDSLTCLAATFLAYDEEESFEQVIKVLVEIYGIPFEEKDSTWWGYQGTISSEDFATQLWLAILERVFALGALAVRNENWNAVRSLTLRLPQHLVETEYEHNWLRHSITMASRASHFRQEDEEGRAKELSLLSLARTVIIRLDCLRPDLSEGDADRMLTSLAQFDFLFNVVAVGDAKSAGPSVFYPNFARVRQERIQPLANRLVKDPEIRRDLYPLSDAELARALKEIGYRAHEEGWRYDGFNSWSGGPVHEFIEEHLPPEETNP
jgi:hypothetical protein